MNLELLNEIYSEMLVDQVVHTSFTRELGYSTRLLVTDRGATFRSLEILNCTEDGFPITFWTDKKLAIPGWVAGVRPLDFVVFAHPEGIDLLPFIYLRRSWSAYGKDWCKKHPLKKQTMDGFEHLYVLVPRSLVLRTSQLAMTWALNPPQGETDVAH
jgi:hypothetical protein